MDPVGRFFLCGRCRAQVLICSHCDRGQIYCALECSHAAREESQRHAGRRYQHSRRGRFAHAERARRYRQRRRQKNNVTHQGSLPPRPDVLLPVGATEVTRGPQTPARPSAFAAWRCHFCGGGCAEFVRSGFLRRRTPRNVPQHDQRGSDYDHLP